MLRIIERIGAPLITVVLEGRLLRAWVPAVRDAVDLALARGSVRCNLAALTFADEDGITVLLELEARGIELADASPLIQSLMSRQAAAT
jgi:hypothetical protein